MLAIKSFISHIWSVDIPRTCFNVYLTNNLCQRVPLYVRWELKAALSVFLSLMYSHFPGQKWQLKGIISAADKRKQEGNGGRELDRGGQDRIHTMWQSLMNSTQPVKELEKYYSPFDELYRTLCTLPADLLTLTMRGK